MKREAIEKAARKQLKGIVPREWNQRPFIDIFVDAAEWRINSVWHDVSVKPDTNKGDLLVIVKDAFGKEVYVRQNAYYVLKYGCIRWAYIEDLLPNTED